jgi:succinate dehydrogenase hydrophobic anchor subunit
MQASQQVNKLKNFSHATSNQRIVAAIVFFGIVGFFIVFGLAGHYGVDMGRWLGYCGFKQRFGLPCPTCGMTTMALAFARGKILEAFYIQPAGALLCCLLVVIGLLAFFTAASGVYFRFIERFFKEVKVRYIILALIIIIAAGWAVTLARAFTASN